MNENVTQNGETSPASDDKPAATDPANAASPAENAGADKPADPVKHDYNQPRPAHPCVIGIRTAWDMVAGGQTREAAADWLARNYPQHFKTSTDAGNAMELEKDHC